MSKLIDLATKALLIPQNLDHNQLESVLGKVMGTAIDSADVFLQSTQDESWYLEDGIVRDAGFSLDRGFGLRVISGEKTGFAYADDIDLPTLQAAASSAKSIAYSGGQAPVHVGAPEKPAALYSDLNPITSCGDQDKVALLQRIDQLARQKDTRVKQVFVRLTAEYDTVLMMNSDGTLAADVRPLVHLSLRVIVEQKGRREQGAAGGGGRDGYAFFLNNSDVIQGYVDKAVNQALVNLDAKPAPAGTMPVVLAPGWPAILLHEAVGHGLEGDFNRKGSSAFTGRIGERVASELCTVVDDGTITGRRGSLTVDDEGIPSQCTVLIEKGILKNYMQDRLNAKLMKMQPTGNGRRESYADLPLPRMTNTYMLPGESEPDEIIASIDKGVYAVDFSGGQVDITSGKFVFTASEAYWVERGKIKHPIKGATLIGNGPDILLQVSMVGNDMQLDSGQGVCGKDGQSVPVGVGQPTIKVERMTVGGVDTESP